MKKKRFWLIAFCVVIGVFFIGMMCFAYYDHVKQVDDVTYLCMYPFDTGVFENPDPEIITDELYASLFTKEEKEIIARIENGKNPLVKQIDATSEVPAIEAVSFGKISFRVYTTIYDPQNQTTIFVQKIVSFARLDGQWQVVDVESRILLPECK